MFFSMRCWNRPVLLAVCVSVLGIHQNASGQIRFEEVTQQAGLLEPLQGIMGHGGAWGDIDNDGLLDLYVGGFCDRPNSEYLPAPGPVHNYLFRNLGDGTFEIAKSPPLEFYGRTSGAVFADLNNNGRLELYVANNAKPGGKAELPKITKAARNQMSNLFRNDGDGKFVDISESSGAVLPGLDTARNIGVLDVNQDGLLDLFVVEDTFTKVSRSALLLNLGNLKFRDITASAGIPEDVFGLGLAVADLNEDGRPDFFVGHSNRFFLSKGDGTYHEPESLRKVFAWEPMDREEMALRGSLCRSQSGWQAGHGALPPL